MSRNQQKLLRFITSKINQYLQHDHGECWITFRHKKLHLLHSAQTLELYCYIDLSSLASGLEPTSHPLLVQLMLSLVYHLLPRIQQQ